MVRVWRPHVGHRVRTYNGGLGAETTMGSRGRATSWSWKLLHLHNLSSWPICPKICLFAEQKNWPTFGGHGSSGPAWICHCTLPHKTKDNIKQDILKYVVSVLLVNGKMSRWVTGNVYLLAVFEMSARPNKLMC